MTGDQNDLFSRLKGWLPNWFGQFQQATPILDAVLQAPATVLSFVYSLYAYARLQTRILTATDGWLDLIAADFFGINLPRAINQADASYRARILANIIRERGTRNGVVSILTFLTGRTPQIFEFLRPADTGGYRAGGVGYGVAGGYGSFNMPYQAFVTVFRPLGQGIPNVAGYGVSTGAYRTPSQAQYADIGDVSGVTDADIYAAVNSVRPAGTTLWVNIASSAVGGSGQMVQSGSPSLDFSQSSNSQYVPLL